MALRGSHSAVMRAAAVSARPAGRVTGAVTVGTCCLSMLMIAIDTTVVNLALPLIGRGLHAPVAGLQWIIAAYSITTASLMLTSGAIGDRFGRRSVLQAGLAVFTLASAGCSMAPNAGCLMLAQAPSTAPWAFLAAAYAVFGAGYGAVNTVISAVAVAGMPRAQAGVAGGVTSAGRQAGQSLGVSVTGAIFAAGLHGPLASGFAAASHPAWLVIAACGVMVLLLGLVSTSRRALRTAALAAALRGARWWWPAWLNRDKFRSCASEYSTTTTPRGYRPSGRSPNGWS
jgi:MFS family permease